MDILFKIACAFFAAAIASFISVNIPIPVSTSAPRFNLATTSFTMS